MRCRKSILTAALVVLVALAFVPAASTSGPPSGERIWQKQVLIPLYNWDTGKIMIGSTPLSCQYVNTCAPGVEKYIPKLEVQPFYLVVYPMSAKGVTVECTHDPADNCPDHGPLIAAGAAKLVPSVYGEGVLGHNHLSAPVTSKDYRVIAEPVLVLFKTRAAANEMVTTRAQVMALVKSGAAFLYPAPQYTFINYVVDSKFYAEGKNVKPMKMH